MDAHSRTYLPAPHSNRQVCCRMSAPYHLPAWLLWVQALDVPALAGVGAFLAYQQMQIARTKLQHDLYERRIKVYPGIAGSSRIFP